MSNKAAFPMIYNTRQGSELDLDIDLGMTIREYFAAQAMQGLLARGVCGEAAVSQLSVTYADALLAALAVPQALTPDDEDQTDV